MKSLIEGLEHYEKVKRDEYRERFAALADGQNPLALFLTCADSRVVPNLVVSAGPGDLFVVRNVANLVPPADYTGDASVGSAVWYATDVLGVKDIIVCGHSGCGGMKALMSSTPPPSASLRRWLAPAAAALDLWRQEGPYDPAYEQVDQLSQICTRHQLDNLRSHSFVKEREDRGELRLHAWWFDIKVGRMLAFSPPHRRYLPAVHTLTQKDVDTQNVA
ncbi:MAG: carbonic anhydrase [Myxococcaceae bacterium]